jgi:hypothetical protein
LRRVFSARVSAHATEIRLEGSGRPATSGGKTSPDTMDCLCHGK